MASLHVLVITYNHVNFLPLCLESILQQETQHEVKIHIIEDCSTDGTQDVVREYLAAYPDRITAVMNPVNVGRSKGIQVQAYSGFIAMKGDYIAILEGDDLWSVPDKVEVQIAELERDPRLMVCAHNCVKVYEDGETPPHRFAYSEDRRPIYLVHDFVYMTSFFHLSTLIVRNLGRDSWPACFRHIENNWCCDIFYTMLFTQYGPLRYIDRDMSIYRAHAGGNFSTLSDLDGRIFNIEGLLRYNAWLGLRYLKGFSFSIHRLTREALMLGERGRLPVMPPLKRLKYRAISKVFATIYDLIDRHPRLDPACLFYGEGPKPSKPRIAELRGYDKALG